MERYTIKPNKKLNRELFIYGLIMFIFIIITYLSIDIDEDLELLILVSSIIIICYNVLFLFPVFILQANYSKYNKNTELVLLKDSIVINHKSIQLDSIMEVNIYATHQYFSGHIGASTLTFNEYFYYLEIITNSTKHIVTSLLGNDIDKSFYKYYPDLVYNKIKRFPLVK